MILADCPHSSHWTEDRWGRMVRCACWVQAHATVGEEG